MSRTLTGLPGFAGNNWKIHAHPYGTDVAFRCAKCDHPVLASIHKNLAGSNEKHPTTCKGKDCSGNACGAEYFVELIEGEKFYIHAISQK